MAEETDCPVSSPDLRRRIIEALQSAFIRLKRDCRHRSIMGTNLCADLWDDQLELIELLMEMEVELGVTDRLDWQKAPKRSETVNDFIEWALKGLNHG